MREDFHAELRQMRRELVTMCELACSAMQRATRALIEVDLPLAEQVIHDDDAITELATRCDERACTLLALQSPVARDLRTVISGIRAAERLNRMGDLARHVAEIARRRHPQPAVPSELAPTFTAMSEHAVTLARTTQAALEAPTTVRAPDQEQADDYTDRLHGELIRAVGRVGAGYSVRAGVDVALLARFVERFADQAVSTTRLLDYILTGELPHQTDAATL